LSITKRNWLTRPLIGRWWDSHLYSAAELQKALGQAGFRTVVFKAFPLLYGYFAAWGYVVEAAP
jgi:hypothetical protein